MALALALVAEFLKDLELRERVVTILCLDQNSTRTMDHLLATERKCLCQETGAPLSPFEKPKIIRLTNQVTWMHAQNTTRLEYYMPGHRGQPTHR